MTPLLEKREAKYCTRCGKELVHDDTITGFDAYTGEPIRAFIGRKHCPDPYCVTRTTERKWSHP